MSRIVVVVLAVAMIAAACGSPGDTGAGPTGRVHGSVLAGPTCPVEREGEPCEPVPVSGVVELVRDDGIVASADLDATGSFELAVPAGDYVLSVDVGDRPFPACQPTAVGVVAGADVVADVDCDTGIR